MINSPSFIWQFIRLRRICSRNSDYLLNSQILCKKIYRTRLQWKELTKTIKQVAKTDRNKLLRDRLRENKVPQTILVSAWHPKLSAISSILKNNFHLIFSDPKLSNIFKQKPTVTYRKKNPRQITFRITILQISNFIPT